MSQENYSRRDLLKLIGLTAGSAVMYQSMLTLAHAKESDFTSPPLLENAPKGAHVVILGCGMAGLVCAHELRKAGYKVTILEFNDRIGGRSWSLRGGDKYTELGGIEQTCQFDTGLYINPGPWRIPYHHRGYLHYAREFGVKMEAFNALNNNALLHNSKAFGGKPQRYRHIMSDYIGHTSELLSKAISQDALDQDVTNETKEILLESLKTWGALDNNYRYTGETGSPQRGFQKDADAYNDNVPSTPISRDDIITSRLWQTLNFPLSYEYGSSIFEPVGGMDVLPKTIGKTLEDSIHLNCRVSKIIQSDNNVRITYQDLRDHKKEKTLFADWCICTIPFSVLSQLEHNFSPKMEEAIAAVPYSPGFKTGVQFKRRFWEEDEAIYGGISFTDLPIGQISYPSTDFLSKGKGVLLGAYTFGVEGFEFGSMTPEERLKQVVDNITQLHPQAAVEFDNGISVAWHRVPFTHGCCGVWTDDTRQRYYKTASTMDQRVVMAGEHISYIPAWQEGAILSALGAIQQLHARASNAN